ncbi:peptidoglycan DD-metalloendopeptidase family protein [Brevundimonas sp. 2R-24]|uniref:Peptidoglycan DD-metalloendopeptidase family protein n=1 Tax=Peiella sedimenti TaxID=3061083 RepID=A0ABT8SKD7_9CAUL|nr:peptidoglycan DD-metalloendopeptidase family protein [Caulobacteraceae bacterium XZ-24]
MVKARVAWLRDFIERVFPERHLYLRSGGETRGYILTTGKQVMMAGAASVAVAWIAGSAGLFALNAITASRADHEVVRARAASERMNAELQARLDSAVAKMTATNGSIDELAHTVERRHAALTRVMATFRDVPGAREVLAPRRIDENRAPLERVMAVRLDQERLIARAENFAGDRAERLRLAFRLAGLNPSAYAGSSSSLGGPLVDAGDPRALAAVLDVDEAFAIRIRHAADNLSEMRALSDAAERLPFGRPATGVRQTSGFGVRFDPFNGRPALHQGQDFAGPRNSPITATAPGVISFAGVRNGYGNTVEIDHGGGFKTRYAHLNTISVRPGQRVAIGQRIGGMGTTGRSTGVHLHYEVWVNGRPQNPARFIKAGDNVLQD